MQWTDGPKAGFTAGDPWIKLNPNYPTVNAERQRSREDSVLAYYRRLVAVRKDHRAAGYGDYEQLADDHPSVLAYRRTSTDGSPGIVVVLNVFDGEASSRSHRTSPL